MSNVEVPFLTRICLHTSRGRPLGSDRFLSASMLTQPFGRERLKVERHSVLSKIEGLSKLEKTMGRRIRPLKVGIPKMKNRKK